MNELIRIEEEGGTRTVKARDLHEFLEVKSRFNDWIKGKILKFQFIEGQDFTLLTENLVSGNNAISKTYHISIDMAKELSMVENNEKGREARKYFIACEKKLKEVVQLPGSFAEALRLAADQAEQLEAQRPKVEFVDNLVERDTLMTATQIGQKHGMSAVKLNKILDGSGIVYDKRVKRGRVFKQSWVDGGCGELKQTDGGFSQALFTTAGEVKIAGMLTKELAK